MFKIKSIFTFSVPIAIGIAILFYGCKKDHGNDLFKPTGKDETRIREVSGFNKIKLYNKIDLHLTQGPVFEVKVTAGKNLHIGITTTVDEDSTLSIKNENDFNFIRSQTRIISVSITAPHFHYLENKGVGTIYCNNTLVEDTISVYLESSGDVHLDVNTYTLKTSSHGNGDVYVTGSAFNSFNNLFGTNILDMRDCNITSYMYITSNSVCNAHVKAPENGLFEGDMYSSGNVYYSGNPSSINFKVSGKGQVIKE